MKKYKMLKSVPGVREGDIHATQFKKGETYELDESLAEQFYHQGAIDEAGNRAKVADPEDRETKVTSPAAYKGEAGEAGIDPRTQRIEELNATARDHYGVDTDTKMSRDDLQEVVEDAADGKGVDLPAKKAEPLTTENAKRPKSKK